MNDKILALEKRVREVKANFSKEALNLGTRDYRIKSLEATLQEIITRLGISRAKYSLGILKPRASQTNKVTRVEHNEIVVTTLDEEIEALRCEEGLDFGSSP